MLAHGVAALSPEDRALLTLVQAALPLTERPFRTLGERLGLSEEDVIARLTALRQSRLIRKIGPVFEPAALGLATELVAVQVTPDRLDAVGRLVSAWPEVTHCYAREHAVNLWFAGIAASGDWFAQAVETLQQTEGVAGVWRLPTLRRFKISVQFNLAPSSGEAVRRYAAKGGESEQSVKSVAKAGGRLEPASLRALQADLPLVPEPFAALAESAGLPAADLLAALHHLVDTGVIRRYGALVSHRLLGFTANAMTVWCARECQIEQAGSRIAASSHVSHCYSRPSFAGFPYNLYAMIHAQTREECLEVAKELTRECGLEPPRALFSTTEYKKSAPDYVGLLR